MIYKKAPAEPSEEMLERGRAAEYAFDMDCRARDVRPVRAERVKAVYLAMMEGIEEVG